MADAYICRGGQFEFKTFGTIKVKANSGATVTCAKDGQSYGAIVPVGSKFVDFRAELGTWTITSTFNGKVKDTELEVEDINNIYEVDLYTEVGSIKVIGNNGTVVNCKKGIESFDKSILEDGYVQFDNLELGEWTITSTYKGKTNTKLIAVSEDGQVYEVNHYIYFGSIKVLAHPNTSITVKKGEESYTQSVGAGATFILFQLLEFGTWNITSTYNGKTKTGNINVQSESEVYQIDHNINIASIRVICHQGTSVKCQKGEEVYNLNSQSTYVDFNNLDFGTWTITSTYNGKTRTNNVELNVLGKLYQIDHNINVANIRVNAYNETVVKCVMGVQSFTQTVSSSGFVTFSNLDFGTWTITSVRYGKIRTENVTLSILNNTYQITHNIESPIYGIAINQDITDPTSAVTYTNDAVGFTPLSCNGGACNYGSWDKNNIIRDFFGIRPCLVKDGVRTVYLNPDNYAQDINGSPVDITSGNAGDVMIEFKKCWYRYRSEGNTLYFEISNTYQEGFVTTAFKSEDGQGRDVDYFYYGAYGGYVDGSNKLRSLSGKAPSGRISYNNFLTYAANNGSGYTIECFCKRIYVLGLLLLVTKSRDIQAKIGQWGSTSFGIFNTNGLFYGARGVKCFGIENMWGFISILSGLLSASRTSAFFKKCAPYAVTNDYTESLYNNAVSLGYQRVNTPNAITAFDGQYKILKQGDFIENSIILPTLTQVKNNIGWTDYYELGHAYSGSGNSSYVPITGLDGPFSLQIRHDEDHDSSPQFGTRLIYA